MKKFLVILSSLALIGGVSNAMEEGSGDEMMMEAPAPSVTVGATAKIGVKSVDDDSMADAESMHLVREYKVTFDSSGTTDGGLMFGAGISIIDEHEGGGDVKAVGGSKVYVGSADGSWKLQFGGNDAGALLAGGVGIADDAHDRGDADFSLSGAIQGVEYRLTMADPQKESDDWSLGAKYGAGAVSVGIGLDSEEGYAIGATTDLAGLETTLYYSKSEWGQFDNVGLVSEFMAPVDTPEMITYKREDERDNGVGDVTHVFFNQGSNSDDVTSEIVVTYADGDSDGDGDATTNPEDRAISAITGLPSSYTFAAGDTAVWNADTGILTVTDDPTGTPVKYSYQIAVDEFTPAMKKEGTKRSYEFGYQGRMDLVEDAKAMPLAYNVTSIGAKVAIPAGENAKFILGYSQQETDLAAGNASATRKDTRIEMDFEYGLGGGATFVAGIDKDDQEQVETGVDATGALTLTATPSKSKTTLEAMIKFSF